MIFVDSSIWRVNRSRGKDQGLKKKSERDLYDVETINIAYFC